MDLPSYEAKLDPLWRRYLEPVPRLQNIVALGPMHQTESPDVFGAQAPYPLLANRDDVLVFQTAPLAETIEVTGIAVDAVYAKPGLLERLRSEGHNSPADLVFTVDIGRLTDTVNAGLTQAV